MCCAFRRSILLAAALTARAAAVRIASLSDHDSGAWVKGSSCEASAANKTRCNLEVYEAAAAAAAGVGADVMLYPEAYGLALISDPFEPFVSVVGRRLPCNGTASDSSPQQRTLACVAQTYNLTVFANVFATLPNGTKRIMELVYDPHGTVLASYSKAVLFPSETRYAEAGPFAPTTVDVGRVRFGLVICYEGVYPNMPWGDWDQIDGLKKLGADAVLWSIGSAVPEGATGELMAQHAQLAVAASEDTVASTFIGANGTRLPQTTVSLTVPYYTAKASIAVAEIRRA